MSRRRHLGMGDAADPARARLETGRGDLNDRRVPCPTAPGISRVQVERVFHNGLKASDPQLRRDFFALYNQSIGRDLYSRLQYIFSDAEWESLATWYWITQALDTITALVLPDMPIKSSGGAINPSLFPAIPSEATFKAVHWKRNMERLTTNIRYHEKAIATLQERIAKKTEAVQQLQQQQAAAAAAAAVAAVAVKPEEGAAPAAMADGAAPAPTPAGGPEPVVKAEEGSVPISNSMPPPPLPAMAAPMRPGAPVTVESLSEEIRKDQAQLQMQQSRLAMRVRELDEIKEEPVAVLPQPYEPSGAPLEALSAEARELLEAHAAFLEAKGPRSARDFIAPLVEAAHEDANISHTLWILMWPVVWTLLNKEQQTSLARPIISLLSKEFHNRQQVARPNVIQTLLEALLVSQPQPKLPAELLRYLGKGFNCWHVAISFIEQQHMSFPSDQRPFEAFVDMYRMIGDEDMVSGLWKRRPKVADDTKIGLSLTQHGFWETAQQLFEDSLHSSHFNIVSKRASPRDLPLLPCGWGGGLRPGPRGIGSWAASASNAWTYRFFFQSSEWLVSEHGPPAFSSLVQEQDAQHAQQLAAGADPAMLPRPGPDPLGAQGNRSECLLWEDRWIQASRNLGHWKPIQASLEPCPAPRWLFLLSKRCRGGPRARSIGA